MQRQVKAPISEIEARGCRHTMRPVELHARRWPVTLPAPSLIPDTQAAAAHPCCWRACCRDTSVSAPPLARPPPPAGCWPLDRLVTRTGLHTAADRVAGQWVRQDVQPSTSSRNAGAVMGKQARCRWLGYSHITCLRISSPATGSAALRPRMRRRQKQLPRCSPD